MNISVYLFGKFDNGYTQYPNDYSRKIFDVCHQNSKAVSQIAIHRDGDLMYYAYIRNLDDGNYIGLCSVVNGKMITNIDGLFSRFEIIIESMVKHGYLIRFNEKGEIVSNANKLYENREEIDFISAGLRYSFEQLDKTAVVLPSVNYSISKDSVASFSIQDSSSDIVKSSRINGYTLIYKSKGYNTIQINSYQGVIAKKEKESIELREEQHKLKQEIGRLKNKQRNTTWVSVFAIAALILGVVVWNKVLFPDVVTNYDAGEYMYYGPMENGKPNGIGIAIYPKNDKMKRLYYYGNFTDGQRVDSAAIMFYKDGSYFRGSMNNDKWFKGIFFDVEKEHFIGEFNNGEPWNGTWYKHVPVQKIIDGE